MKTAREIACGVFQCGMRPRSECSDDCDLVTAAIDQARRDGAEWMRERAVAMACANAGKCETIADQGSQCGNVKLCFDLAHRIRAIQVTP